MQRHTHTQQRRSRSGFTLIELLMVIVIIALLLGLLLPAIMSAVRKGREAAVSAEINAMGQALAQFKSDFGDYPPSRIILSENGDYSSSTLTGFGTLPARSIAAIRRIWPRVQLNTGSTAGAANGVSTSFFYDFNGDGALATKPYILTGDEALVFFLGGIPTKTSVGYGMTGWGKSPSNPFVNSTPSGQSYVGTANRKAPYFEFQTSRLVDNGDGDGTPVYKDSIDSVSANGWYYYFSSYSGVGYDPDDGNAPTADGDAALSFGVSGIVGGFMVSNSATGVGSDTTRTDWISSPSPNPYVADDPIPVTATSFNTADFRPRNYVNPQSFQIISPGYDRFYGIGGQYNTRNGSTNLPFTAAQQAANSDVTGQTMPADVRSIERDNLTNFATGRIDP